MKYPIRKEFQKFSALRMPVNPVVLKLANALMPFVQRGKRLDKNLSRRTVELTHCKAELIAPQNAQNPPVLIYYHGGAFMMKAAAYHKNLAQTYAKEAGCAVLFVDYRLAPKYKFPLPVEDCFEAYRWALGQNFSKMLVGGDSAGGSLALAVLQRAKKEGLPMPKGLMLVYPVADSRMQTESMKKFTDTPLWNSVLNEKMYRGYASEGVRHDPWVSPMEADDLSFLPPTYLETAECDCLHDEGVALADRLEREGVAVTRNDTEGTIHGYDIAESSAYVQAQVGKRIAFLQNIARGEL